MYFFYFYPIGLEGAVKRRPVLSWALMAVMLVAFLWLEYGPNLLPVNPWFLVFFPGNSGPMSVVTAVFMHGSWLHLLGNLLYLHVFGAPLEDRLGRARFLLYFLMLGVAGNLAHGVVSAFDLLGQGGLGVLGASGAIAGLLSFALLRFGGVKVRVAWWILAPLIGQNRAGRTPVPVGAAVAFWLLLQVAQTLLAPETGSTVSFGAHLGGFGLGLALALVTGQKSAGRSEALAARARSYFRDGQFYAAAGAWTEYLELCPTDRAGRLGLARAQLVAGQTIAAGAAFRRVYDDLMAAKRVDEALRVYDEATRGGACDLLAPEELARVARFKEKQLDEPGALDVYRQLFENHPRHAQGQRALVRMIVILHGRADAAIEVQRWLQTARDRLPPGTWRDYLEREFKLGAAIGAGVAADLPGSPQAGGP